MFSQMASTRREVVESLVEIRLNRRIICDSSVVMKKHRSHPKLPKESLAQGFALVCLLVMGGFAVAGPSGVLAWSENLRQLDARKLEITRLAAERDQLKNRVDLLNPRHADADLAGELLRSNLNVAHPDEMVMLLR
jgi:cell division protein FtsB